VYAPGGFDNGETAALTGLRRLEVGVLKLQCQLIGLGKPSDFRAKLFGGPAGSTVWVSATPYIGPAHVGRLAKERYLRKALRREARRWVAQRQLDGVEVEAVEAVAAVPPRPLEFRRGRSRAGDDGYRRPLGTFRVTFSAPVEGPLALGYSSHFGLGLFLPCAADAVDK